MQPRNRQIWVGAFALTAFAALLLFAGMGTDAPGQRMIVSHRQPDLLC